MRSDFLPKLFYVLMISLNLTELNPVNAKKIIYCQALLEVEKFKL